MNMPLPAPNSRNSLRSKAQLSARPHVLVIEDEQACGERIVRSLTQTDVAPAPLVFKDGDADYGIRVKPSHDEEPLIQFDAELVTNCEAAYMYLEGDTFDIYFVDLKLKPVISLEEAEAAVKEGLQLVSRIRQLSKTAGIIVLSGEDAHLNTVSAITSGANFYLEKPLGALAIRMEACTLWNSVQHQRPRGRTFQIGEWNFTLGSRTLINERGDEKRLPALEYALLAHLIGARNHEIDKMDFAKHVLGGEHGEDDRRVDSIKKRLAKNLGDSVQIISVRDHGYKLLTTL